MMSNTSKYYYLGGLLKLINELTVSYLSLSLDNYTKSVLSPSPQGTGHGVSNFKLDQLLDLNALDDYTND
jgi:hypothetical protein